MEREFLDKVEDNAAVRVWSKKVQQEKVIALWKDTCQSYRTSLESA
ncbi:hypothetical protein Gotur_033936 [Gossypium turneri]